MGSNDKLASAIGDAIGAAISLSSVFGGTGKPAIPPYADQAKDVYQMKHDQTYKDAMNPPSTPDKTSQPK